MNVPFRTRRGVTLRNEQLQSGAARYRDRYFLELARLLVEHTNKRAAFLPNLVLEDPEWLMTLELFIAAEENREVSVTSLCAMSGVPSTTALRHIKSLERKAMFQRVSHPRDKRISHVRLSDAARLQVARYLLSISAFGQMIDEPSLHAAH
jgi:DNA-binding MarR family transcriptional regulator